MFGLIKPYYKKMLKSDRNEYKCYYCGLCVGMGRNIGFLSRFLINYDICLLYLLADSLYLDTEINTTRCPFMFGKKVKYRDNAQMLNKMANINYILTYHKVVDNINDDNSFLAKILELLMRRKYLRIKKTYKNKVEIVVDGMCFIRNIESQNKKIGIEEAALPFGEMLENVMKGCLEDNIDDIIFSTLCRYIGMWIYVVDACLDLKKDIKTNNYNPLKAGYYNVNSEEIFKIRREEIIDFFIKYKQTMLQLLDLFSCGKNEKLVKVLFDYILPEEVANLFT